MDDRKYREAKERVGELMGKVDKDQVSGFGVQVY